MFSEFANVPTTVWGIFFLSLIVALTGSMSPGPLLTYTIIKSAQTRSRGYLIGLWVIVGHAILEIGIIFLLLMGFSFVLKHILVVRFIGVAGGMILIFFGGSIIRDVRKKKISAPFLEDSKQVQSTDGNSRQRPMDHPIVGGVLVSMSNPYWWIWWATIGLAFMIQFNVSIKKPAEFLAFFFGHEAGDLLWYLFISSLTFFGVRFLNKKVYYGILVACGLFMIGFGVFLGVSPFFKSAV